MADTASIDDVLNDIGFGRFHVVVLLLCGTLQSCDMMEILFSSLVSHQLQCLWWFDDFKKSMITSAVFLGLLLGSLFWGIIGDVYSRVKVTALCVYFVVAFGLLSAAAPSLLWVVVLRFLVGVGVGGVQPLTAALLTEFSPASSRGAFWFSFQFVGSLGYFLEIGLAWAVLQRPHGWQILCILTALPPLITMVIWLLWMPESPRQSLVLGHPEEAKATIKRIARTNQRSEYEMGGFKEGKATSEQGRIPLLFASKYFTRLTVQYALMYFAGGFTYYGLPILSIQVPLLLRRNCDVGKATNEEQITEQGCHACYSMDYLQILIPLFADLAIGVANATILERLLSRKILMSCGFAIGAVMMPFMALCQPTWLSIILFLLAKFFAGSAYFILNLCVAESYPTTLRSIALATLNGVSRLATVLVPFVAQAFVTKVSLIGGLLIFSALLAIASLDAMLLPVETKDAPMLHSIAQKSQDAEPLNGHSSNGKEHSSYGSLKDD